MKTYRLTHTLTHVMLCDVCVNSEASLLGVLLSESLSMSFADYGLLCGHLGLVFGVGEGGGHYTHR